MLQWSYTYVTSVCSKCFICFQIYVAADATCCKCSMSERGKWAHAEQVVPSGTVVPCERVGSEASAAAPTCMCSSNRMRTATTGRSPAACGLVWGTVRAGGGRRCMHTQAFRVLSSHMGVVSCQPMLCLTVLDSARVIVTCVSQCTKRV
jgi:hypothetical protein